MLFSSLTFLLYFLPAVLVIHYFLPRRAQNLFLLIASIIFYAWGEAKYVPLIIALLLINFALGRLLSVPSLSILNRKILLFLSVFVDIGVLIYYKYAAFLLSLFGGAFQAPNVTLPLGISFFTFQLVAYLIDVSKASVEAEKNPIDLGAFILLFPQLIAGPIIRYADMRPALHQRRRPSSGELQNGMAEFIAGLALKVLIANPLGEFHTTLLAVNPDMPGAWLSALAFGLQIYFDFFGYSLMAIGIGKMLGFDIPINFDHPYAARSVREFWRRWHITLGNWFRDYVYIPLGGSRKGEARTLFNLFCVWSLTGLWHGAAVNFILWGVYYFILLALERSVLKRFLEKHPHIAHGYTLIAVFAGWILFSTDQMNRLPALFSALFSFSFLNDSVFYLRQYAVVLVAAILLCIPSFTSKLNALVSINKVGQTAVMLALLLLCLCALIRSSYNPFLYFRF